MLVHGATLGPHDPVRVTPERAPGSIRRTATIDTTWPEGLERPRVVDARARDLRTDPDGHPAELAAAALGATLEPRSREVLSITSTPTEPALAALLGIPAATGFRSRVDHLLPHLAAGGSLLYLLLDDLPGAALVAGFARLRGGVERGPIDEAALSASEDLCAGWAADGFMIGFNRREGHPPAAAGPRAPALEREDDSVGWHATAPLPPHGMRRRRRIDVVPNGDVVHVDAHFRDSHVDEAGVETVVHEYVVAADVDPSTGTVIGAAAGPRVLPWHECPAAATSAVRLGGHALSELRPWVRATFVGTSTCTHLNDTLRGLADVPELLRLLQRHG